MQTIKFVIWMVAISVVYGILHDLVTANVCVEYFTEYHPHIIDSKSPFLMAFIWGVLATWWFGLIAGIIIAVSNGIGYKSQLRWSEVRKRIAFIFVAMLIGAYAVLGITYFVIGMGASHDVSEFELKRRLISVANAHAFSYLAGAIATLYLPVYIWRKRNRLTAKTEFEPASRN